MTNAHQHQDSEQHAAPGTAVRQHGHQRQAGRRSRAGRRRAHARPVHRRYGALIAAAASLLMLAGLSVGLATDASAAKSHKPIGALETITLAGSGGIQVKGWAADPDSTKSVKYMLLIDKKVAGVNKLHVASVKRSDIAAKTRLGSRHGFKLVFTRMNNGAKIAPGKHRICIKVRNIGQGSDATVACKTYTINFNPTGAITSVKQVAKGVEIRGWSYDRDRPTHTVSVTATVNKVSVSAKASKAVSGMPAGVGAKHGFTIKVPVAANGTYSVCVRAKNLALGKDVTLPCTSAKLNFSPTGAITALKQAPGGFSVEGWALDPDSGGALPVTVLLDGAKVATVNANGRGKAKPGHTLAATYPASAGSHSVCLKAGNAPGTPGAAKTVACQSIALNFNPTATIVSLTAQVGTVRVRGTAIDPDTKDPVQVNLSLDGGPVTPVTANLAGSGANNGHVFQVNTWAVPTDGAHTFCATPVNLAAAGPGNPKQVCSTITLDYSPTGVIETNPLTRDADGNVALSGWAADRNTTAPVTVSVSTIDGAAPAIALDPVPATAAHAPVTALSGYGNDPHGFTITVPASLIDANVHDICLTATGDSIGAPSGSLGCQTVWAVNPTVPAAPAVTVSSDPSGALVSWAAPDHSTVPPADGGGQMLSYTVSVFTTAPDPVTGATVATATAAVAPVTVAAPATSVAIAGLAPGTVYSFSVVATNTAGSSAPTAVLATTDTAPPPQTTPAPVSTSRYVRNIHDNNAADIATSQAEGVADATANPSGHRYLILLQIGGQSQSRGGVVLTAGVRFVSYAGVVANVNAYVDGYASAQTASAPVTIAIGTNNDMDVNATTGATWATQVVNPVVAYAAKYPNITIAGANDIEPGFKANYASSAAWLGGYLGATAAQFVFNGSADGCSSTATGKKCNNGWTMAGLYNLAAGAAPSRIVNLPQIYNTTMPKQWKFISLTGIVGGKTAINFGGPLTEWTACDQAKSCGSLTGVTAWGQLWAQLQSDTRLQVPSLPYSTDLRIDS